MILKLFKYIFLGIIQGITEPLPISSSGHVIIFENLFNLNNDLNFEIVVNFGSFIAISYILKNKIKETLFGSFKYIKTKNKQYKHNYNYTILIIIGTLPAAIIGLLYKDKIDIISNNIKIIGLALLITSFALYYIKDIKGYKKYITKIDAFIIGLFQSFALLPGISRSGSTITGAMIRDINKKDSFEYSFMLYLPISIATIILGIKDLTINNNLLFYFIGFIFSTVSTYFSFKLFYKIIKKEKLIYFSIYCLIVGIIILLS